MDIEELAVRRGDSVRLRELWAKRDSGGLTRDEFSELLVLTMRVSPTATELRCDAGTLWTLANRRRAAGDDARSARLEELALELETLAAHQDLE